MIRKLFSNVKKVLPVLIASLFLFSGCEDINFGGDLRVQLEDDVGVDFYFYEFEDDTSEVINKKFILGKTFTDSYFPSYERDEYFLMGYRYLKNPETGSRQMPENFSLDEKNYISSIYVTDDPACLYAVWAKKCYVTFVTNCDQEVEQQVVPAGECVEWPWPFEDTEGDLHMFGWCTDPECTQYFNFNEPIYGDITLYARWRPYNTITYHRNLDEEYIDDDRNQDWDETTWYYEKGQNAWISYYMFANTNKYGFVGWSKSSSASSVDYNGGDEIQSLNQNLDLWGVWSSQIVTVTYHAVPNYVASAKFGKGAMIQIGVVENEYGGYPYVSEYWNWAFDNGGPLFIRGWSLAQTDEFIDGRDYYPWQRYQLNANTDFYAVIYDESQPFETVPVDTSVSFTESPDNDISVNTSQAGSSYIFTADTGYSDYKWYIGTAHKTEYDGLNQISVDTSTWTPGVYYVRLEVTIGSVPYSWTGQIVKN